MLLMHKPKVKESGADIVDMFLDLIQALLKDPEARQHFFTVTCYCTYLWDTQPLVICFKNHR